MFEPENPAWITGTLSEAEMAEEQGGASAPAPATAQPTTT